MPRKPGYFIVRSFFCTNVGGVPKRKLCKVVEGKRKADACLARLLAQLEEEKNGRIPPKSNCLTAEVHDLFLDFVKDERDPSTYETYVEKLRPFFKKFGDRPLASITEEDGRVFKKFLAEEIEWKRGTKGKGKGLGPTTVNWCLRSAKALMSWAVEKNYLLVNPWKKLRMPRERIRERLVSEEEFEKLLKATCSNTFKAALRTLRWTAMRPGELRTLKWEYVHFDRDLIIIPANAHKTSKTAKKPKPRLIPLLPEVKEVLQELFQKTGPTGYAFLNRRGNPWTAETFSRTFEWVRKKAGLDKTDHNGDVICAYSLRHSRLSEVAILEKWPISLVQQLAGHDLITTTQRYLHPQVEDTYRVMMEGREKRMKIKETNS